ncbi:MAG: NusG domain II-containing protein [Coriobacteriales bacterium]|nr:NusG domain II-containing protein [Coriobacteriales bacterium]
MSFNTPLDRRSVVVVVGIFVVALLAWSATAFGVGGGKPTEVGQDGQDGTAPLDTHFIVRITDGDGMIHELPLDQNARLEVSTALGSNLIAISDGMATVEEADCPGGDCIRQRSINTPGQTIICLPHRLVVEIVQSDERPQAIPATPGQSTADPQATSATPGQSGEAPCCTPSPGERPQSQNTGASL